MADEHHKWIVDAIEEGVASVEEDGERIRHLPLWMLPPGAREGAVLSVVKSHQANGVLRLTVAVDEKATREAGEPRERPRNPHDPGGDIVL